MKSQKKAGAIASHSNSPAVIYLENKCKCKRNTSQKYRIILRHFGLQSILTSYFSNSERVAL